MADSILATASKSGFLYRLSFPDGKAYIGITTWTVEARFSEHCANARRKSKTFAVHAAIRKFGAESVKVETLAAADWAALVNLEIGAIAEYGTYAPGGYNLTRGGEGMFDLSPESRAKKSAAMRGRSISDEQRQKISEASKRQMQCPDMRALLSKLASKRTLSDETKTKISAASKSVLSSEAMRQKISAATKAGQDNPAVRARMQARSTAMWAKEGARALHAEKIKAKWADPEWKARALQARLEKRRQTV